MAYYLFNKDPKLMDPLELKGKLREEVSLLKLATLFAVALFQLCTIFKAQDQLFATSFADNEILTVVISFISGGITFIFNARISILKKENYCGVIFLAFLCTLISSTVLSVCRGYTGVFTQSIAPLLQFLQLQNLFRYMFVCEYAIRCKKATCDEEQKKNYYSMVDAEADVAVVFLLDCFLREVPQKVVHVVRLLQGHIDITTILCLDQIPFIISLALQSWTITSYHKNIKNQQSNAISYQTMAVYFLWNLCVLLPRIICIGAAISLSFFYTSIAITIHWIAYTFWLYGDIKPLKFYNESRIWHFLFCSVFGVVYLFKPVNLQRETMRNVYVCFYAISFVENTSALTVWFISDSYSSLNCKILFTVTTTVVFILGILIMILYYKTFEQKIGKTEEENDIEICIV
ncbi:XK-related protein 6 [Tribolium castaneum]|uniref:XK-related protein n=1 Tax=Tribolium castaneum TaxID=7070 RepID=A0A139WNJ8_TRICA|nr:PREDICTED: XK-related protein 6 [Tribolium castaneum]KYB29436.1 hypothetical protein TcasGA2_TC031980 [Tribolium castaneum]|eukprot:XP_008200624.2 PREDICTED: XK-related protein 6 [Tribolium castaneum]